MADKATPIWVNLLRDNQDLKRHLQQFLVERRLALYQALGNPTQDFSQTQFIRGQLGEVEFWINGILNFKDKEKEQGIAD